MSLHRCKKNGKSGWKWGANGKCFTGPGSRGQALAQGKAIEANKQSAETASWVQYLTRPYDPTHFSPEPVTKEEVVQNYVGSGNDLFEYEEFKNTDNIHFVDFKKADEELQIVYGEVYVPNLPDTDGEFMTEETVRETAHGFLKDALTSNVDKQHDNKLTGSFVVESFIAQKDDPVFIAGSWVVGVKVPDPDLWQAIKDGEINGFSLQAKAIKVESTMVVDVPEIIKGETYEADDHIHKYTIQFGPDGNTVDGRTDEVNGHHHVIKRGTFTEAADGHTHRFSFMEALADA